VFDGDGTLSSLLTAPYSMRNDHLAAAYGEAPAGSGDELTRVDLDPATRAGILTQASILATFATSTESHPVLRGRFVREQLLCQPPPPVPDNFTIPEVDPTLPVRERYQQHATDPGCAGCHVLMDPIGFGFERYDAFGVYRDTDALGQSTDASGAILHSEEVDGEFTGVVELAGMLASSRQVQGCISRQWFRHAFDRVESPANTCSLESMNAAFVESGGSIGELIVALTRTDAFRFRPTVVPGE
jgi:hypothetical protein